MHQIARFFRVADPYDTLRDQTGLLSLLWFCAALELKYARIWIINHLHLEIFKRRMHKLTCKYVVGNRDYHYRIDAELLLLLLLLYMVVDTCVDMVVDTVVDAYTLMLMLTMMCNLYSCNSVAKRCK